jgi:predicted nucleotidyltransferase
VVLFNSVLTRGLPGGRIAREVFALLIATPGQELHTREIARRVGADAHPTQRALELMLEAGLVQSRRLGNLRLWSARADAKLAGPVAEIVRQTAGIAAALRQGLSTTRGVQLAFLFGSYASGQDSRGSDIDLFIVGSPDWTHLSRELTKQADTLGRELNSVVWTIDEFQHLTATQQRFLNGLMRAPRIWLVGDDDELERLRSAVGAKMVRKPSAAARGRGSRRIPSTARAR